MMFKKKRALKVENVEIGVKNIDGEDYISLTDMLRAKDGRFYVESWLRNRNTIEFVGMWESINNPSFNFNEFDEIRKVAGLNSFRISVKEWTERTNAIGLRSVAGRYGGTFAHKDIAFEFGMWVSPAFKLYLIKDYERLKEIENNSYQLEWNVRRVLASATYTIHTDAVKDVLIPKVSPWQAKHQYASEADVINLALFGVTAKEWRDNNPGRAKFGENLRDSASINELLILEMLQIQSAELVRKGLTAKERFDILKNSADEKRAALAKIDPMRDVKRLDDAAYLDSGE